MDPHFSGQDAVCCTACETALAPMYCEVCHIDLCKDCGERHIADKFKDHRIVSIKQFLASPKCQIHLNKHCKIHCEQCEVPICSQCVVSKEHKHHDVTDIMASCQKKKEVLKKDLEELENIILPRCQERASNILQQRVDLSENSQKVKVSIQKQGDMIHKEIDIIIHRLQAEIDENDLKYVDLLDIREKEMKWNIAQISETIFNMKKLLESRNVNIVSKYKPRNEEFRILPPIPKVSLPNFKPQKMNREQIIKQIGSLIPLSVEKDYISKSQGCVTFPHNRPLLEVPQIITELYAGHNRLYGVSCLSDDEIWTHGDGNILMLKNLKGETVKCVQTKSGNGPVDITVTRNKELVYTDYKERSINLVSHSGIQPLIRLKGWRPKGICNTASSNDLLVIMHNDDNSETKVVRYSGTEERQTIQRDEQGRPLYSSSIFLKYLTENTNLDICVADNAANAVVVVSATGKFRFRYTGRPSIPRKSFFPFAINKDSQGRILTTEKAKNCIHVIDQDGLFLRYIDQCDLHGPFGLCLDSSDNILVTEFYTGKLKKIKFYK